MNKKQILITAIAFLISCFILVIGTNPNTVYAKVLGMDRRIDNPKQLYRVYLSGKSIGLIESKKELEEYIDEKQQELKAKYGVEKVYAPNDLDVIREVTYNETISTVEAIYKKIEQEKGNSSFTIDGYRIDIKGLDKVDDEGKEYKTSDNTVYVLEKDIFTDAIKKTITAFVDSDTYEKYTSNSQQKLEENETGTLIENLYIKNNVFIKKERVPAGGKVYQTAEELSKYLLFGTTDEQETYIVKAGDTVEEIANNNRLSPEEFLIANTSIKTAQDLLYPGQQVKLGAVIPQFDLVEVKHEVSKKAIKMDTIYKNDDTQYVGYEKVEQEGQDGLALVTEKIELVNGEIKNLLQTSNIELIPSISRVVVRGTKYFQKVLGSDVFVPVGVGSWVWPTESPYSISSYFSWRWGKHHDGLDITGRYNSTIKAANNGIIVQSDYSSYNGNYIIIKHSNGYYTYYGHMASRSKAVGNVVMAGDKIGSMGQTGFATGVHLHFGVYYGYPFRGGVAKNPYIFY